MFSVPAWRTSVYEVWKQSNSTTRPCFPGMWLSSIWLFSRQLLFSCWTCTLISLEIILYSCLDVPFPFVVFGTLKFLPFRLWMWGLSSDNVSTETLLKFNFCILTVAWLHSNAWCSNMFLILIFSWLTT